MAPKSQQSALVELLKRSEASKQKTAWLNAFFGPQRAYVTSEAKVLAALCSRRAGKSIGNAGRLISAAEAHPNEISVYIALTKNNARMVVGRALMDLSRQYDIGLKLKEVDQRLMCIHPNGHYIWLAGAKNRIDFEQFRGYRLATVIIDEAQLYGTGLREVVEDVLEPCVGDLDGSIALTGTPSPLPIGFFHSVTTGDDVDEFGHPIPQWETHHWTVAENQHFRIQDGGGAAWRESIRQRRGWNNDHPTLLREYYGRWVKDLGALVYPYDQKINAFYELPPGDYKYVIGVDVGFTDDTAFVVFAYRRGHPEVYVISATAHENMIPSRTATHLMRLRESYPNAKIVVDAAARGYIEEFKQRFGLPAESSEKQNKMAYIDMLRGDIMSGVLKLHPRKASELIEEMQVLQWKDDRSGIDERFPDHVCFIAGTQVTLADGAACPIEQIVPGDLVQTRFGPQCVSAAGATGCREIWRVETESGRILEGTEDHPVLANGVMTPIKELQWGDELQVWNGWPMADSFSGDTQTRIDETCGFIGRAGLEVAVQNTCTDTSGNCTLGPSRQSTIFTTKTATPPTTLLRIWSAFQRVLTFLTTCVSQFGLSNRGTTCEGLLKRPPRYGTEAPPESSGTERMQLPLGLAKLQTSSISAVRVGPASIPERREQQSAPTGVMPSSVAKAVSTTSSGHVPGAVKTSTPTSMAKAAFAADHVTHVTRTQSVQPVYNLTVAGAHEYFANEILVSNCDAMLYGWRAVRTHYKPEFDGFKPGSPEAINAEVAKQKLKLMKRVEQKQKKSWKQLARQLKKGRRRAS